MKKLVQKNKKINSVSIFNSVDLNDDSDDSYNYSSENSDDITGSPEITTLLENLKKAKENYEINEIKLNDSKEIKKIKILNEANDPIVNQFKLFTSEKNDTIKTHNTSYVEVVKLQENTISDGNSGSENDKEVTLKETEDKVVEDEDQEDEDQEEEDEEEEVDEEKK